MSWFAPSMIAAFITQNEPKDEFLTDKSLRDFQIMSVDTAGLHRI